MKRSAYAALAMAMAISLSGCSGQTSATTEPEQTSVVQQTETETETSEETTEATITEPTAPEKDGGRLQCGIDVITLVIDQG